MRLEGDFWRSSSPASTSSSRPQQGTQSAPRMMSISKDGDSTSSLGNLSHKTCHLVCFRLCPLPLVLFMSITEKNLAPSSFFPSIRYSYTVIRLPLNLLQRLYHFYLQTAVWPQKRISCKKPQQLSLTCTCVYMHEIVPLYDKKMISQW